MPRKRPPRGQSVALGDCYEAAGKFILGESRLYMDDDEVKGTADAASKYMLVHAEVAGQGPLFGTTFGHAFVVDTERDIVIDRSNNRNIQMPRFLYYGIAGMSDIDNYHEYTPEEMMARLIKYRHWGPWELKTRSGL